MSAPYPINPILKYVVKIWMFLFMRKHNISGNISHELKNINKPYLLLSNHYGRYDPFIISYFFKKRPNFVSSDAILRDRIIGTLFKGLGAMPKKKGVRDSSIIREMVKVVRAGGSLALFPEGTRTWNGVTSYMDPSIAKLVRLLKVPVITARMKGAYLMDPRWAIPVRQAAMEIDYALAITADEIASLTEDEIFNRLWKAIYQDDIEYQLHKKIKIKSLHRAEQIDLVLFDCPDCKSRAGFNATGNEFRCKHCAEEYIVDDYGFLALKNGEKPKFDNVRDWINWQNMVLVAWVSDQLKNQNKDILFSADHMAIECAKGNSKMKKIGVGSIDFYIDRIEIEVDSSTTTLEFSEISSLGAQFKERIELFYNDLAYRFTNTDGFESGLKWELATNVVWANTGSQHKVSAYFQELVLAGKVS